ncbi:unnamed protein product [Trichogramma brassicae]|uniref:acid phosphatase n=1 Tax=Trichogramma brassicae TaxID=86971 RepID=A0A6H5J9I2_9HYME|nr:unnamed protein product [Trichogramma brassicae]
MVNEFIINLCRARARESLQPRMDIGMRRMYRLGQMLRKRYADFLGDDPETGEFYARSTESERTRLSLQLVLAGLIPPRQKTRWHDELDWVPMPVHYDDHSNDILLTVVQEANYRKLLREVFESADFRKQFDKYKDFYARYTEATRMTCQRPLSPILITSNLKCAQALGLPRPDWCSDEDFATLEEIMGKYYDSMVTTDTMKKLSTGPFLEEALRNIRQPEDGRVKMYLYSAHEFNLGCFLRAHGPTNGPLLPEFGSCIAIEKLRGKDDRVYIRVSSYISMIERKERLRLYHTLLGRWQSRRARTDVPPEIRRLRSNGASTGGLFRNDTRHSTGRRIQETHAEILSKAVGERYQQLDRFRYTDSRSGSADARDVDVNKIFVRSDNGLSPIPKQVDRYWKKRRVTEDDSDDDDNDQKKEAATDLYTSSMAVLLMKSSEESNNRRLREVKQCWRLRCESFDSDDTDVATDQPEELRDLDMGDEDEADLLDATLASEFLAEINNDHDYDKARLMLASTDSQESQQMEAMELQSDDSSTASSVFESSEGRGGSRGGGSLYSTDEEDHCDSKMDISPEPNSPRTYVSSFEIIMPDYPMDHQEAHRRPTENT